ncbi:MAG TPA: Hpt domain-containing protein [Solirubrobacteraceae bacterium]|jgi:chemotaxis protein histidine kinase CheA|nr:Hpt domain-containing protein [Solirubrobacteraceae bacterium]
MQQADDRSIATADSVDAGWSIELLRSVWNEQRPVLFRRVETIEQAATALEHDRLGEQLRSDAQRAAHMLAGSLAIFGLTDAGEAARELELVLEPARCAPERAQTVLRLLARLPGKGCDPLAAPSAPPQAGRR